MHIRTLKIKIRPESYQWLDKAAKEVNFVWNWCNETSYNALTPYYGKRKYLSAFDLINLSSGASKEFNRIGSANIQNICREYATRRNQFKKLKLRWRSSGGSKKNLGWIPLKPEQIVKIKGNGFNFCKKRIRLFENIEGYKFKEGCFAQDVLGHWYLCVPVEVEVLHKPSQSENCGIDLGLGTVATTSGGDKLEYKFYRDSEKKLANAQRRGHKKQAKFIHRKIRRQRADATHKFSRAIINKYQNIYIGDVSFNFLKSGNGAKSAYDGAIGMLKTQLQYKGQQAGRWVEVISEKFTTQACSACGCLSGPTGRTGLVVREWQCSECETEHDRDINAAINICHLGMKHHPPFAGTSQIQVGVVPSAKSASAGHGLATTLSQA